MSWLHSVLFVCALAVTATHAKLVTEDVSKCFPHYNAKASTAYQKTIPNEYIQSRFHFSIDLMKEVIRNSSPNTNVFFSPHSIYQALLLALFISNGYTEDNIRSTLRIPDKLNKVDLLQIYKHERELEKTRVINSSSNFQISNANKFFVEDDLQVRDCMKKLLERELQAVDFKHNSYKAVHTINSWVANQTRYQISDFLSEGDVNEDTKLILVNAMYFKGLWQSKFLPEHTNKTLFYSTRNSQHYSFVTMMRQKGNFKYFPSEKLHSHVLQLPYKGEEISMFILLPALVANITDILLNNLTPEIISEVVEPNYLTERPIELELPKFTVEQKLDNLVPILKMMGVGDLFEKTSDLSALTGNNEITFNDAVHKAKVSVDEQGTTASAVTSLFTFRSSRPSEPFNFTCNHPFAYFIYDNVRQTVLFMGVYNKPENEQN